MRCHPTKNNATHDARDHGEWPTGQPRLQRTPPGSGTRRQMITWPGCALPAPRTPTATRAPCDPFSGGQQQKTDELSWGHGECWRDICMHADKLKHEHALGRTRTFTNPIEQEAWIQMHCLHARSGVSSGKSHAYLLRVACCRVCMAACRAAVHLTTVDVCAIRSRKILSCGLPAAVPYDRGRWATTEDALPSLLAISWRTLSPRICVSACECEPWSRSVDTRRDANVRRDAAARRDANAIKNGNARGEGNTRRHCWTLIFLI